MTRIETLETSFGVRHAFDLSKVTNIQCGPKGGVTLRFLGGPELVLKEFGTEDYDRLVKRWAEVG
ncbi:MAG: hypothetical protein SGJ21_09385 [Alphaproteobacteria bacterium]|nr:hypothetical protein [Alphaproteobacteria bacterium]